MASIYTEKDLLTYVNISLAHIQSLLTDYHKSQQQQQQQQQYYYMDPAFQNNSHVNQISSTVNKGTEKSSRKAKNASQSMPTVL